MKTRSIFIWVYVKKNNSYQMMESLPISKELRCVMTTDILVAEGVRQYLIERS